MKRIFLYLAVLLVLAACVSTEELEDISTNEGLFEGAILDRDFTWSSSAEWEIDVNYSSLGLAAIGRKVTFVDDQGRQIYQQRIQSLHEAYSFKTEPAISKLTLFIPSQGISTNFELSAEEVIVKKENSTGRMAVQSVTCDCDNVAPSSGTLTVNDGDEVCIVDGFVGNIFFSGAGTVNICADATLYNVYGNAAGIINIGANAHVSMGNWNSNYSGDEINNLGQLVFNGSVSINLGTLINSGTLEIKGSFNQNGGSLQNTGVATIQGSVALNQKENTNEGLLTINGGFNLNSSAKLSSSCQIVINGAANINGQITVAGSSYTYFKDNLIINSGGKLDLEGSNAHVRIGRLTLNGDIKESGSNNLISVDGQFTANSSGRISSSGALGLCTPNYGYNNSNLEVIAGCEFVIPASDCNPSGVNANQDSDKDGAPDEEDQYPNDPGRCYTMVEPATGYKVIAFEDLWPYQGDYDFNDLVIKQRTVYTKNASNEFVDAEHTFIIEAIGASVSNGFGIHYLQKSGDQYSEITNSVIKSVNGATAASGNTVVVTDDIFSSLSSFYKNNGSGPSHTPDTLTYYVEFESTRTVNMVADLYMFRSDEPGREIHLPGVIPTVHADESYFNTGKDRTGQSAGWYRTENNLPWAMEIYLSEEETYRVPLENVVITDAYPEFAEWAVSNGTQNQEWSKNYVEDKVFWNR